MCMDRRKINIKNMVAKQNYFRVTFLLSPIYPGVPTNKKFIMQNQTTTLFTKRQRRLI